MKTRDNNDGAVAARLGWAALVMLAGLTASCNTLPGVIVTDPAGACCLIGGNCIVVPQDDCLQQLGTYLGDGLPCGLGPCPG